MKRSEPGTVAFEPLLDATFVARPNRYLIVARLDGRLVESACRDPGRLEWLLSPGVALLLRPASPGTRRTRYDVALVRSAGLWTSLVPALANRIFEAAVGAGTARGLRGARVVAREVVHGHSRFDFVLARRGERFLTEVKSVGHVVRGRALFPDAPTARGTRHVRELTAHARRGGRSLVVFLAQRSDARTVAPDRAIDPDFADALAEARGAGVRLLGFNCRVSPRGTRLDEPVPVVLA